MKILYENKKKLVRFEKEPKVYTLARTNRVTTLWGVVLVGYSTAYFNKKLVFL